MAQARRRRHVARLPDEVVRRGREVVADEQAGVMLRAEAVQQAARARTPRAVPAATEEVAGAGERAVAGLGVPGRVGAGCRSRAVLVERVVEGRDERAERGDEAEAASPSAKWRPETASARW